MKVLPQRVLTSLKGDDEPVAATFFVPFRQNTFD